ncbi:sialate O-acetylesterase [Pelagicoccus sp. SDUM812003]|uniref:sialate O-acetylesterase n=1 Tax=Pelagicoccus sp. SDUM812003 TaxID=3041267 RepID=UPI00280CC7E4|nr:sialate O-acetylesterase [Pelagicoccus sp. SDUM812003]MDQ8204158.1 sialate O-acetylesterase [Pelagicoccus sp. SDUM812003]
MKKLLLTLTFVGVVLGAANLSAQDEDFYIFLCFGQSNMEGYPGIPESEKGPVDPRFQVLAAVDFPEMGREKGQWYTAVPPLSRPPAGLSPADYFGRALVAELPEDKKVGVINVAVGGTKIELFDETTREAYLADAPDWLHGIASAYDKDPYARLVEMGKLAQKDGVIKGILLHQGESNTGDQEWPAKVKTIYRNLLSDLDLQAEDVPLIAGEVVAADQNGKCASMNEIIRTLPETIPTAHVVSSEGCPDTEDDLHFSPEGYQMLGERYAKVMLDLLEESE